MNILVVTPFFSPQSGGVATYVQDLRRLMLARGHNLYVMRPGESDYIKPCSSGSEQDVVEFNLRAPWIQEVPIRGIAAFCVYLVPTVWKLYRFISKNNIQLVSLEYPLSYMMYFLLIRQVTRIPVIVGLHGSDVLLLDGSDAISQWIVRRIITGADWVLAHSASLLKEARHRIGGFGDNCSYLHYGVECERFRNAAREAMINLSFPKGGFILTVAKLYPRKGLDVLLRAIHILRRSSCPYRFVIIGDGPEEHRLKVMAKELSIEPMVEFLGDVKNHIVPAFFEHCAFFVLPSRVEPFGIVLLEAMTFGKAIVATSAGGIPEFIRNGHNGMLVPVEDSEALAERIDLLIRDKSLREALGGNARVVVEQEFDYDRLVVRYEELFQEQIKRRLSDECSNRRL